LDAGEIKPVPEEQMWRAAQLASAEGRRWEVELETRRMTIHPGATVLLGPSALAGELSPAAVRDLLRHPLSTTAHDLAQRWRRGGRHAAAREAILVRMPERLPSPRVRLFAPTAQTAPRRAAPGLWRDAPEGEGRRPADGWRGWPFRQWSQERERRVAPWLGPVLEGLARSGEAIYLPRRRPRWRSPGIAGGIVLVAATALVGTALWWGQREPPASVAATSELQQPAGPVLPTPPALAGRSLLVAVHPFLSLAAGGPSESVHVLDTAQRFVRVETGEAESAVPGQASLASNERRGPDEAPPLGLLTQRGDTVLWLDADRRLWELPAGEASPRPLPLRGAAGWRRPVAMATYAGNLYILDAGDAASAGQIWRIPGTGNGGYDAEPQAWLRPDSGVSLHGAIGFAIDGAIWVTRDDGSVLRLAGGRREPFQPAELETPILSAGPIYTAPDYRSVYVVDAAARRVVQLAKSGPFERQVREVFPAGEHPRGLWVDEATGRALVLTDQRLQEVTLGKP
ncbi:MAG: hypothetical protein ACRDJN_27510, partial [Chloroflexota bacterium]